VKSSLNHIKTPWENPLKHHQITSKITMKSGISRIFCRRSGDLRQRGAERLLQGPPMAFGPGAAAGDAEDHSDFVLMMISW
jgi:hypothetical protein